MYLSNDVSNLVLQKETHGHHWIANARGREGEGGGERVRGGGGGRSITHKASNTCAVLTSEQQRAAIC